MKSIRIAIISDLHCRYGKETPSSTYLYSDLPRIPITKHPIQALKSLIKKESLVADYVICPGDITDKINIQGLISGYGFINEIKNDLCAKKLICVPGNHDVDSRKNHPDEGPFEILKKYIIDYPLEESSLVEKFWANNFAIYKDEDVQFLIINSVFNHFDIENAQKSVIPERILDEIKNDINKDSDTEIFKIAICHHHPIKISSADSIKYKDGDSLENGDSLLNILDTKYSIFIHGHKHIPQLVIRNTLPIFCAGSFSSLENIIETPYKNCFHIINLNLESNQCKGKIETWFYTNGKGWAKSKDPEEAFPSLTGFGLYTDINEFALKIKDWFVEKEKERIHFSDVLTAFPDIEYLTPIQQESLINELLKYQLEFNPALTIGAKELSKQLI